MSVSLLKDPEEIKITITPASKVKKDVKKYVLEKDFDYKKRLTPEQAATIKSELEKMNAYANALRTG